MRIGTKTPAEAPPLRAGACTPSGDQCLDISFDSSKR